MARRSEKQEQVTHPYVAYQKSPVWKKLDQAIDALVSNGDLKEMTRREYIVGYLVQALSRRSRKKV